jgi:uncharacterized protein (DUF1330 family)
MGFYFLAVIQRTDLPRFAEYQAGTVPLVKALEKVEILAVTDQFDPLLGDVEYDVLVLLRFADEAEFRKWWDSPEYRELIPIRAASAQTRVATTFSGVG